MHYSLGSIHKRRRNVLGGGPGEGGSQISMLQDTYQKIGVRQVRVKFRHGGGGYQKWPKTFRRLLWTAPAGHFWPYEYALHSHCV